MASHATSLRVCDSMSANQYQIRVGLQAAQGTYQGGALPEIEQPRDVWKSGRNVEQVSLYFLKPGESQHQSSSIQCSASVAIGGFHRRYRRRLARVAGQVYLARSLFLQSTGFLTRLGPVVVINPFQRQVSFPTLWQEHRDGRHGEIDRVAATPLRNLPAVSAVLPGGVRSVKHILMPRGVVLSS